MQDRKIPIGTIFTLMGTICGIFTPTATLAGEQTGKITSVIVRQSDDLHYFYMSDAATGSPSCVGNPYWILDEKSEAGKAQFAMVMSAYLAGTNVRTIGKNTCTRWSDGEDVLAVQFLPPS